MYSFVVVVGNMVYVSGIGPLAPEASSHVAKVGAVEDKEAGVVGVDAGTAAARACALTMVRAFARVCVSEHMCLKPWLIPVLLFLGAALGAPRAARVAQPRQAPRQGHGCDAALLRFRRASPRRVTTP